MAKAKNPYTSTLVNFHLPQDLALRITEAAKKAGKPKVRIAIEAFEAYLGRSHTPPTLRGNVELDEDA